MRWISKSYLDKMNGDVMKHVEEYGYSPSLYRPTKKTELWGDYNLLARKLLDKGIISTDKYNDYLSAMRIT